MTASSTVTTGCQYLSSASCQPRPVARPVTAMGGRQTVSGSSSTGQAGRTAGQDDARRCQNKEWQWRPRPTIPRPLTYNAPAPHQTPSQINWQTRPTSINANGLTSGQTESIQIVLSPPFNVNIQSSMHFLWNLLFCQPILFLFPPPSSSLPRTTFNSGSAFLPPFPPLASLLMPTLIARY